MSCSPRLQDSGGHPLFRPPYKEIAKVAPDLRCQMIMQQIYYWAPKAKMSWAGHKYVVKSRHELAEECGLSFDQVKRALAELRARRLMVIERHLWKGKIHLWIRFPVKSIWEKIVAKSVGAELHQPDGAELAKPVGAELHHPLAENYIKELQTENYVMGEASSQEHGGGFSKKVFEEENVKKFGGKVSDVVKDIQEQKSGESSDAAVEATFDAAVESPTPARLAKLFQVAWANAGFGFCQKPSGKEFGQLKSMASDLGGPQTAAVLLMCVQDWTKFAPWAADQAGFAGKHPAKPSLWFLHQHRGLGVAWVTKAAKSLPEGSSGASATLQDEDLWGKIL